MRRGCLRRIFFVSTGFGPASGNGVAQGPAQGRTASRSGSPKAKARPQPVPRGGYEAADRNNGYAPTNPMRRGYPRRIFFVSTGFEPTSGNGAQADSGTSCALALRAATLRVRSYSPILANGGPGEGAERPIRSPQRRPVRSRGSRSVMRSRTGVRLRVIPGGRGRATMRRTGTTASPRQIRWMAAARKRGTFAPRPFNPLAGPEGFPWAS